MFVSFTAVGDKHLDHVKCRTQYRGWNFNKLIFRGLKWEKKYEIGWKFSSLILILFQHEV